MSSQSIFSNSNSVRIIRKLITQVGDSRCKHGYIKLYNVEVFVYFETKEYKGCFIKVKETRVKLDFLPSCLPLNSQCKKKKILSLTRVRADIT